MPFIVQCDGKFVRMPIGGDWMVERLEGRLPNAVSFVVDEDHFKDGFERHAIWCDGIGNYATVAYCGGEPTIQRHATLKDAVIAKRAIDDSGCGGRCVKVHLIVEIDPTNSRKAREQENIRRYMREHLNEDTDG